MSSSTNVTRYYLTKNGKMPPKPHWSTSRSDLVTVSSAFRHFACPARGQEITREREREPTKHYSSSSHRRLSSSTQERGYYNYCLKSNRRCRYSFGRMLIFPCLLWPNYKRSSHCWGEKRPTKKFTTNTKNRVPREADLDK